MSDAPEKKKSPLPPELLKHRFLMYPKAFYLFDVSHIKAKVRIRVKGRSGEKDVVTFKEQPLILDGSDHSLISGLLLHYKEPGDKPFCSYRLISKLTGVSYNALRRAAEKLESAGMIIRTKYGSGTLRDNASFMHDIQPLIKLFCTELPLKRLPREQEAENDKDVEIAKLRAIDNQKDLELAELRSAVLSLKNNQARIDDELPDFDPSDEGPPDDKEVSEEIAPDLSESARIIASAGRGLGSFSESNGRGYPQLLLDHNPVIKDLDPFSKSDDLNTEFLEKYGPGKV